MTQDDKKLVMDKLAGDVLTSTQVKELLDELNDDAYQMCYEQWQAADDMEQTDFDKSEEMRESASLDQTNNFKQNVINSGKERDIWHRVATDDEVLEWIEQYWPSEEPFRNEQAEAKRKARTKQYEFED